MSKFLKGFKAFNKGLKCQGFQYEVGKEHKHDGEISICQKGFHFCENPLDTLNYYDLCESEFAEVETNGETQKQEDENGTKICTDKIFIKTKLDLPMFIKASFDFLWENCNKKKLFKDKKVVAQSGDCSQSAQSGNYSKSAQSGYYSQSAQSGNYSKSAQSGYSSKSAQSGYYSQSAQSGDSSKSAQSGYYSQSAQSGNYSQSAQSGNYSQSAQSGYYSKSAQSGNYSKSAQSGYSSKSAQSGYYSQSAQSGDCSQSAQSGDYSKIELNGLYSVGASIGKNSIIKGKKGCWITLAEYDNDYKPICVKSVIIDGKNIKEDVWYKLENKKFKEVK